MEKDRDTIEIRSFRNIIYDEGSYFIMKAILLYAGFMIVFSGRDIHAQSPDIAWTQTFGGPDDDSGFSVQQTSDGGYIVAGITGSYTTSWDAYLIRTDSNGDSIWTKTFGGSDDVRAYSVQQTTEGALS